MTTALQHLPLEAMSHHVRYALLLSASLVVSCGGETASPGRPRDLLGAVPADAAIVVSTLDWDDVRARAEANHFVELLGGDTWRDLTALVQEQTRRETPGGFDLHAAFDSLRGELALYFRFVDGEPEFGLIAEATAEDEGVVRLWESLRALAEREGDVLRRLDDDGVTLHVVDDHEQTAFFRTERLVGLTVSEVAVEDPAVAAARGMLARLASGDRGIAATDAYRAAIEGRPRDPAVRAFVAGAPLVAAWPDIGSGRHLEPLGQLGVTGMEWGIVDLDLGAGEQLALHASIHVPQDTFLADLLEHLQPAPLDLLESVPSQAYYAAVGQIDAAGAFRTVREFQQRHASRAYEHLSRDLEEMREELGFDLERDLLEGLTGRFALLGVPTSLSSQQLMDLSTGMGRSQMAMLSTTAGTAFYAELTGDGQAVRSAERALVARMGSEAPIQYEDVHGTRVTSFEGPMPLQPRWAFHDDLFVFSTHDSSMQAAVERLAGASERSFADLEGVSKAVKGLSGASIVSVTRTRPVVDSLLNTLRSLGFAGTDRYRGGWSWLASIRLPPPLLTPDLFEGYLVQSVKVDDERFSMDLVSR